LKITDIYFTGLTTGCCVSSTARDAYNYNYDLFFVKECLTASDKQAHNYELKFFQKSLGKVIKSKNIKF
jgi:nicotinamidase-related amidase